MKIRIDLAEEIEVDRLIINHLDNDNYEMIGSPKDIKNYLIIYFMESGLNKAEALDNIKEFYNL